MDPEKTESVFCAPTFLRARARVQRLSSKKNATPLVNGENVKGRKKGFKQMKDKNK